MFDRDGGDPSDVIDVADEPTDPSPSRPEDIGNTDALHSVPDRHPIGRLDDLGIDLCLIVHE